MQIYRPIRLKAGSGIQKMEVNRGRELACGVMETEDSIKRHTSQASNSGTRASNV